MESATAALRNQVTSTIAAHNMAEADDPILVACSGGPDSVCLAHVLHGLGFAIHCAYLDHQTRAGASAADRAFVESFAEKLAIPCHVSSRPVEAEARAQGKSFEAYAREIRYAFLAGIARKHGLSAIATGHHADDQAETVLLRLLRGTSPRGLAGIPPVGAHGGRKVIRPLIECPRHLIEIYLHEEGQAFRTDESNADPRYARNKVRHQLLPLLEREYNPRVREALSRLTELLREEDKVLARETVEFLQRTCDGEGAIHRRTFRSAPIAIQRRALTAMLGHRGIECPLERLEAARIAVCEGNAGVVIDLAAGHTLQVERIRARIAQLNEGGKPAQEIVALLIPGRTTALGRTFSVRILENSTTEPWRDRCTPKYQVFDADIAGAALAIRRREPGDRFTPFGMGGSRKLKDYFIDEGVPASNREEVPILLAGNRIIWIVGHAISGFAAVTTATRRLLEIEVLDAAE
jgi:tRNA(Ile)-lysidine synthase